MDKRDYKNRYIKIWYLDDLKQTRCKEGLLFEINAKLYLIKINEVIHGIPIDSIIRFEIKDVKEKEDLKEWMKKKRYK